MIKITCLSLQATQSNIYGGVFLYKKVNIFINIIYFCKKAPPQTFDLVLNMALGNTDKKSIYLKDISPVM